MWKVFLAFACHRLFLLFLIFASINATLAPNSEKRIQSTSVLKEHFIQKIALTPEAGAIDNFAQVSLTQVFSQTKNPFYWIGTLIKKITPFKSAWIILILSNLFCLLFLWELYALTSRMTLPEVAVGTAVLTILWITSYELSLGSYQSLTCFLVVLVVRHALDNTWLLAGLGLGLLALTDFIAIGLVPLLILLFWHYQRHEPTVEALKKLGMFLIPLALVVAYRYDDLPYLRTQYASSSLATVAGIISRADWGLLLAKQNLASTISLTAFFCGMIVTIALNTIWIHRLIPPYLYLVVLLFSDFGSLSSRIILSAVVLSGLSAVSSTLVERLLQLAFIIVSGFEVASIF